VPQDSSPNPENPRKASKHLLIDGRPVEVRRSFVGAPEVASAFDVPTAAVDEFVSTGRLTDVAVHGDQIRLDPDEVARLAEEEVAAGRMSEVVYARLLVLFGATSN